MKVLDRAWRRFLWQLPLFLLAWCLLAEILLRAFLMSPSELSDDPALGWRWPRNTTLLLLDEGAGFRRVSFNALGLNDEPIDRTKGHKRIIVLGDSFVESLQVARRLNFMHIVEHDMPQLRLINAGRSGLDPASELVMLEELDAKIAPDGVIDVVNAGDESDLLSDHITVKHCAGTDIVCDYRLPAQQAAGIRGWLKPAMGHSALLTYLLRKYKDEFGEELSNIRSVFDRLKLSPGVGRPPSSDTKPLEAGWKPLTGSDIEGVLRLAFERMSRGRPMIVVFLPTLAYTPAGHSTMTGSETFIAETARAARDAGAAFLDTRTALAEAYARSGQPPNGFNFDGLGSGHLNALGHRAVAKALEPELAPLIETH